jgi:hypothetical protein
VQEGFEEQLPHRALARLQSVNTADQRCADRNGLSCPTAATLDAMDHVGMMAQFSAFTARTPTPGSDGCGRFQT